MSSSESYTIVEKCLNDLKIKSFSKTAVLVNEGGFQTLWNLKNVFVSNDRFDKFYLNINSY